MGTKGQGMTGDKGRSIVTNCDDREYSLGLTHASYIYCIQHKFEDELCFALLFGISWDVLPPVETVLVFYNWCPCLSTQRNELESSNVV